MKDLKAVTAKKLNSSGKKSSSAMTGMLGKLAVFGVKAKEKVLDIEKQKRAKRRAILATST